MAQSKKSSRKATTAKAGKPDNFIEQAIHNIEERARKEIEELREKIEGGIEEASVRANQRSTKLEQAFDRRVAQAYNRMGLPAKADIDMLEEKIDNLQHTVEKLQKERSTAKPARKTASKKAATKKATSRKATSRKATSKKTTGKKATTKTARKKTTRSKKT